MLTLAHSLKKYQGPIDNTVSKVKVIQTFRYYNLRHEYDPLKTYIYRPTKNALVRASVNTIA